MKCREAYDVGDYFVPSGEVNLDWTALRAGAESVEHWMRVERPPWTAVYRVIVAGDPRVYLVAE